MLESEIALWRERLSQGNLAGKGDEAAINGPVLVSEMSYLRDAGVSQTRLSEVAQHLDQAGRTVKAVKTTLRRESDLGPKALRGVTTAWQQAIETPSDARLACEHFRKLAMATTLAQTMRERSRGVRRY